MSEPFLGELRMMAFNFAPKGWAPCNGQLLPINQNQALFSLLGTMYGGDGRVNFALPDLRGRVPLHVRAGWTQGQRGGEESHTLSMQEMPAHAHLVHASGGPPDNPGGNTPGPEDGGCKLSIHVEMNNPARRLYERLGFRPAGEHGVHVLMERVPT
jgi:Phage Tail Collar Domain